MNVISFQAIGYVYLAQAVGTSRYKIGATRDPASRLKQLNRGQTAHPVVFIAKIETKNYLDCECFLHGYFEEYRVHGEWFQFDKYQKDLIVGASTALWCYMPNITALKLSNSLVESGAYLEQKKAQKLSRKSQKNFRRGVSRGSVANES